ncbi:MULTISPECIES: carbonic anhydrase [unclassified Gemella]|uniref:beta-class carbonic anhydrase n=1 Tax=unclassified Gemella TaxID=2624949 RepID=UPI0015D0BD49|nr:MULTISPECIES: carbonic anhydrase [unclassified Gemella]MBF0709827.1 carbonic anhydrase [Gemella sp. GL1.1]NYS27171.1 carbonic anhydrase [Gemella sp. GL1]
MRLLDEILDYNRKFVDNEEYVRYQTEDKYPAKKVVMVTCMDTRLVELSTKSLNLSSGDVKVIKNAGAILSHPYGSIMRSLIVAIYVLKAEEIIVMGHYDCGMQSVNTNSMIKEMWKRGVSNETFKILKYSGIDLQEWLQGFEDVKDSVKHDINMIVNHPLIPKNVYVHGLVIDPSTGKVDLIENGYDRKMEDARPNF